MYVMSIAMLLGSVYLIERYVSNNVFKSDNLDIDDVILEDDLYEEELKSSDVPVISQDEVISRPYTNANVKVLKSFYDYKADSSSQENSIIYYGNTYMQNSGVDYGMESEFEVVSILDGTVMEIIEDDDIVGKTIKIKHSNDLISVYQSLGNIDVKVDDAVTRGMIIGKSGNSNVSSDLGNHLHFELYNKGTIVNPEDYYDKKVNELN